MVWGKVEVVKVAGFVVMVVDFAVVGVRAVAVRAVGSTLLRPLQASPCHRQLGSLLER